MGGDFYDVYPVGPAQWLVAIGDVCGKGAGAAARTGLMRDVLRVLVREGRSLVRAIELLNDVMLESGDPLQFATLAAALVTLREAGDAADRRSASSRCSSCWPGTCSRCWCAPTAGSSCSACTAPPSGWSSGST